MLAALVAIFVGGDDEGGDTAGPQTTTTATTAGPKPPLSPEAGGPISLRTLKGAGAAKATVTLKNVDKKLVLTVKADVPRDDYRVYLSGPGRQSPIFGARAGPGSGTYRGTWRTLGRYNTVFVDLVVHIKVPRRHRHKNGRIHIHGHRTIVRQRHILSASVNGIVRRSNVKLIS